MEDESAQPHAGMSQLQSCGGQATIGMTFGQKMKIHPAPLLIGKYADEQREFPMRIYRGSSQCAITGCDGAEVFVALSKSNAQRICKTLIRRVKACGMPNALAMTLSKTLNEGRYKGQDVKRSEARRLPLRGPVESVFMHLLKPDNHALLKNSR